MHLFVHNNHYSINLNLTINYPLVLERLNNNYYNSLIIASYTALTQLDQFDSADADLELR